METDKTADSLDEKSVIVHYSHHEGTLLSSGEKQGSGIANSSGCVSVKHSPESHFTLLPMASSDTTCLLQCTHWNSGRWIQTYF